MLAVVCQQAVTDDGQCVHACQPEGSELIWFADAGTDELTFLLAGKHAHVDRHLCQPALHACFQNLLLLAILVLGTFVWQHQQGQGVCFGYWHASLMVCRHHCDLEHVSQSVNISNLETSANMHASVYAFADKSSSQT